MSGLLGMTRMRLRRQHVDEAFTHLATAGLRGEEAFALWVGALREETFDVQATYVPDQVGLRLDAGICVIVGPEELHRLNVWLHRRRLMVGAQIHSHPTAAYHSETDDTYPIATVAGALSLVVPDFARHATDIADCAVYRLSGRGTWEQLARASLETLFEVMG